MRWLSPTSQPQGPQTAASEAAVRRVARAWLLPTEIRELYRLRFGIETSFRQMRQARIYTCTRNPRLRLFFLAVALILRNLWVWIHHTRLAEGSGDTMTLHLELLRFKQMLEWIAREIVALFHDASTLCVVHPAVNQTWNYCKSY